MAKQQPMNIASLIDPVTAQGGNVTISDADKWMQGRTLYGGASALVAYTAVQRAFSDLPPLRAAQIGFVGPVGESFEIRREIVRQGRNVTQVRSELVGEKGVLLTALWLFGEGREPNALHAAERPEDWPGPPGQSEDAMSGKGPAFITENFEIRRAQDERGPGKPIVRRWARLTDRETLDPVSLVILMGDVLPPGAMRAMQRQGPLSSINWSFNLLDPEPTTKDGWWLAEAACQHADDGYSSERLRLWNVEGKQVLDGMQSAAIFG